MFIFISSLYTELNFNFCQVAVRNANYHRIMSSIEEHLSPKVISSKKRTSKRLSLLKKSNKIMVYIVSVACFEYTIDNCRCFFIQAMLANNESPQIRTSYPSTKRNTTLHDLLDAVFFFGDLNYRIDLPSSQVNLE